MQKGIIAIILCLAIIVCVFTLEKNNDYQNDSIRIHIRANSNSSNDQSLKYMVRDELVAYLTPKLADAETKKQAKKIIKASLNDIVMLAKQIIAENGYNYEVTCNLTEEEFPLRSYQGITYQSGVYEALIINLGSGEGDNWWCVAYPPLCFVPNDGNEIVYKSKIKEIIEEYKEKWNL